MDISPASFVSIDELLSDILPLVDDERLELNTKGYYTSMIQQALEALAFETFFDERRETAPFPTETLTMMMPKGAFNLRNVYIFNGTECNIGNSRKVWWKRNYFTKGKGYIANNKGERTRDPFISGESILDRYGEPTLNQNQIDRYEDKSLIRYRNNLDRTYFYEVQNGMVLFSKQCAVFQSVMLEFNGTGCDIGDVPIVPMFLRAAVKDYVCEFTLRIRMAKDQTNKWGGLWKIYEQRLNMDERYGIGTGSWGKAQQFVKNMNTSQRAELKEYLSRGAW